MQATVRRRRDGEERYLPPKSSTTSGLSVAVATAVTHPLVLYGGLRLGLYEPSKYACNVAFGSSNILVKIASGAFAGAFATAVTNPVEVLKAWLQRNVNQMQGGLALEMRQIIREEGIRALWKGAGPAMARAATLTASQFATYDETKQIKF